MGIGLQVQGSAFAPWGRGGSFSHASKPALTTPPGVKGIAEEQSCQHVPQSRQSLAGEEAGTASLVSQTSLQREHKITREIFPVLS